MPRVTASSASPCALATAALSVPITPTGPRAVPVTGACALSLRWTRQHEKGVRHAPSPLASAVHTA